jgi:hypothetical protein
MVPRTIGLDWRWPEVAGQVRCEKCAARFVGVRNQPRGDSAASLLEIKIETERTDRPAAASRLLRVEESEENAGAALSLRDREGAGSDEMIVQRLWRNLRGVLRRGGRPLDGSTHLTG